MRPCVLAARQIISVKITSDIIEATEAAAIAASRWIGSGEKELADKAATEAMRKKLNSEIEIAGKVIMGEGEKDKSFGLFKGETVGKKAKVWESNGTTYRLRYGTKEPRWLDISVDPIEGTTQTVTSGPEAVSVMSVGCPSSMFYTEYYYMNRIAYGKKIKDKVELSLRNPLEENLRLVSEATGKSTSELMVCVLDRPRHKKIINRLRELNVRVKLIKDCDIVGALASCLPTSDVDFVYGIGGSPEAVISASAIQCLGGGMEAQIYDNNSSGREDPFFSTDEERWVPIGDILHMGRLVSGPSAFAATGITDGTIFKGVKRTAGNIKTNSLFMRSDVRTMQWVNTVHLQK